MGRHAAVELEPHPCHAEYVARLEKQLPELVAPTRLARLLDMPRQRVYELVQTGDFAAVRVGVRGMRLFRASVIDWLRAGGSGRPFERD